MPHPDPVYLDHQASTPLDPRVLEAMLPWLSRPANAHAVTHAAGRAAHAVIEAARAEVAAAIGGESEGIVFTSGATEAASLALRGLLHGRRRRVVSTRIEHACVAETINALAAEGVDAVLVGAGSDGVVDMDELAEAVDAAPTDLVSVMAVNNEVGTIQPVGDIARLCAAAGVTFHTDAAQALGRIRLDVRRDAIGMAGLSAHKVYGPQGIGALWCEPRLRRSLRPVSTGGGQEGGLRPGTVPVALAVGFGTACAIAVAEADHEEARLTLVRDAFLAALAGTGARFTVNGSMEHRVAANLNVAMEGVDAAALIERVPELCLSLGSACSAGALARSRTLAAMGLDAATIDGSVRIGFGRGTTEADAGRAAVLIGTAAASMVARAAKRRRKPGDRGGAQASAAAGII